MPVRTRLYTGDDPIAFSVSMNVKRRHLSAGRLASLTDAVYELYEAEAAHRVGGRPRNVEGKPEAPVPQVSESNRRRGNPAEAELPQLGAAQPKRAPQARDKAAKAVGTSGRSVQQWRRVKAAAPDLAEKVQTPEVRSATRLGPGPGDVTGAEPVNGQGHPVPPDPAGPPSA
ncbi:MAG: hypothetical protein L0K86_26330 [Actinomycetia bacterium]|nr:hypothetical protein [Actinomycetes bacterium]